MASDTPLTPGPGKSTADRAFAELTRQVAERNERAHKAARELRMVADGKKRAERRKLGLD
jgi:hypothetical protein